MRAAGQWNAAWDLFFDLNPQWTDEFMAAGIGIYASGTFTPKEIELLSIVFDVSYTHMYAPGTRRHTRGALVLAKVMLIADDLGFGRRFDDLPLIWPIPYKSVLYALLFVFAHELEHYAVAWFNGRLHTFSLPTVGGGTWAAAACVWAVMTVSLMPFFAIRELSQLVGKSRVWRLMLVPGARAAFAAEEGPA